MRDKEEYNEYMAYYMKNRYISLKLKAVEYKGGKCIKCGHDKYYALAFHHRDPNKKEMGWSHLRKRSWEFIKEELDKCDIVCHNCHAETHHKEEIDERIKEWNSKPKPNKVKGTKGRCKQCEKEFIRTRWDGKKKYCSNGCVHKSQEKIKWPEHKELRMMVEKKGQVQTGKALGVSPNTVKKRLLNHVCGGDGR